MIGGMQSEAKSIIKSITEIAYYMKGGISYDALMVSTPIERDIFADFIQEKLDK